MADWKKIKAEYITTDTSYRKLAQKYGLAESTIYARGGKEHWVEQKERHQSKTVAKTLDALSDKEVNRAARLMTVADKLLKKVEQAVDDEHPMSASAIKNLSDALKNIRETQMIRYEADMREQEARIRNLEKQAQVEEIDKEIKVTIVGDLEAYSK